MHGSSARHAWQTDARTAWAAKQVPPALAEQAANLQLQEDLQLRDRVTALLHKPRTEFTPHDM